MAPLIFTIPHPVVAEYLGDFIRAFPIPADEDGNPEFKYCQWVRERVRRWVAGGIRKGKERFLTTPLAGNKITSA